MSSRIVITSWGSYGDVYPYIGVGKALQARGHRVILAVPRYYAEMVEHAGLETRLVHLRGLGPWVGRLLVGIVRRETRSWIEPVTRLRAELGLPPGGNAILEGQFSPILNLALFSRVMAAPQPDWPPHVEETGFVF